MNWLHISLILFALAVSKTTEIRSGCDERGRSLLYLDVASDMIAKAKLHYPEGSIKTPNITPTTMDCSDILGKGYNKSGVYTIWPKSRVNENKPLDVFCDMDTAEGGWTVLQRRGNFNSPNDFFFKDWDNYKKGFGDNEEDFWIGNDNIFALTNQRLYSIRFDLKIKGGEKKYAFYGTFWIDDENNKYTLHIKNYSGDAGESVIGSHNNRKFTTKDQDNDDFKEGNCGQKYKGGWWYGSCLASNLNGLYLRGNDDIQATGLYWSGLQSNSESIVATEIKIRPKSFSKHQSLPSTDSSETVF